MAKRPPILLFPIIMQKTSLLLLFLFAFTSSSLFAQEPTASDCKQYKTGTYYIKNMPNIVITRDAQFQTETDMTTGKYVKMSVTWTSDCTYELRYVKSNKRGEKKIWKRMKVLTVVITSTEEDSYRFSASSPALTEPVRGTIVRK